MKHRVSGKKLNRDTQHRRALQKNLITALIVHGRVQTTQAKAKVVQPQIDKLMTKAKKGSVHDRRQIDAVLNRTSLVNKMVDEIAPKTKRNSGFTRIVKLGARRGDQAEMVRLEWVDAIVKVESPAKKEAEKPAKPDAKKDVKDENAQAAKESQQSKKEALKAADQKAPAAAATQAKSAQTTKRTARTGK